MNKNAKVSDKKKAEPKNKEVTPKFSYEFLDMLTDTASVALSDHLKKSKIEDAEDVRHLFDMVCCLYLEQMYLMRGMKQDAENIADVVTRTVHHMSAINGTWYSATGTVTPLKELLVMWGERKANDGLS